MPTKVHMVYTGIVNYVTARSHRAVHVLMQNATGHGPDSHFAWLVVEDSLSTNHGLPQLQGTNTPPGDLIAYALDGVDIEIDNTMTVPSLRIHPSFERFMMRSTEAYRKKNPPAGEFQRSLIETYDPAKISARSLLAEGELAASWVDPERQWRFDHKVGRWMWLAQEACHTFEIQEDELELRFESDSGSRRLTVRAPAAGQPIEVILGHTLKDDVFPTGKSANTVDQHVKLYYDLGELAVPPADRCSLLLRQARNPLRNPPQERHTHRIDRTSPGGGPPSANATNLSVSGANCPGNNWNG